jgi:hypothetical protein
LREPAGVLAARKKSTVSGYEQTTISPLALIPKPGAYPPTEIPQAGHGIGEFGRCRRGWRDGDQAGDIPAED